MNAVSVFFSTACQFILICIFKCLFIFEREGESASGGGAEREGETGSEAGSRLRAVSSEPDAGLKLWTVISRPEPKSDAQPTEPPRRPLICIFLSYKVQTITEGDYFFQIFQWGGSIRIKCSKTIIFIVKLYQINPFIFKPCFKWNTKSKCNCQWYILFRRAKVLR